MVSKQLLPPTPPGVCAGIPTWGHQDNALARMSRTGLNICLQPRCPLAMTQRSPDTS